MRAPTASLPRHSVGLGLRTAHIDQILREQPEVSWFEVLLDNHVARGGLIPRQLAAVRELYPVSLHCVGMSLAGVDPLDLEYLKTVKRMVREYHPFQVSDHLCFTHYHQQCFNDLLPIPYTAESLHHVCERVDIVQELLGTRILVENLSTYMQFTSSEMSEAEFLNELAERTGCGILLDINNAYVNEYNHGSSAREFIDIISIEHVCEIHLAGYEDKADFLIDAHNNRISDPVWELFRHYLHYSRGAPVLIEWDNDIPALDVLLTEAAKASSIISNETDFRHNGAIC